MGKWPDLDLITDSQADDECCMCGGVNLGKLLSCLGCQRCTHLDCLEAIARVQYMLRQVHYDRDVWLCTKCQVETVCFVAPFEFNDVIC